MKQGKPGKPGGSETSAEVLASLVIFKVGCGDLAVCGGGLAAREAFLPRAEARAPARQHTVKLIYIAGRGDTRQEFRNQNTSARRLTRQD